VTPALLFPALAGVLVGAGLLISGMADPARIIGFLRLAPGWDPSLAFVMAGALAVTLPGYALLHRRGLRQRPAQPEHQQRHGEDRAAGAGQAEHRADDDSEDHCHGRR
jgi:uncharacterized membrane protein YedE/YeeE